MAVKFKIRRGTAAEWTAANPILLPGEPGLETDTEILKIGDGVQLWTGLPQYLDKAHTEEIIQTALEDAVLEGVKGDPGDSAYQVAVDNGFVGTESQWLVSLHGAAGATGAKGDKGDQGNAGSAGATGSTGAQGPKGDTGDQGPQGPQGDVGPTGPTGATGATGSTGSAGSAGAKGDQGDQGDPGTDGEDGDSAYEIAVANGFVGNEAAWLTSLHGATGATGATGSAGAKGDKGDTGDQGPTGATGAAGTPGSTGSTGATGAKGDPGDLNRVTVGLTDGTTIATDCSLGNTFRVTLGGNRTLSNPTNMTDGQKVIWEFVQDGTGTRTITLGSKFSYGTDITSVVLSTAAGKHDFLGAIYNSTADKWYVLAFTKGY